MAADILGEQCDRRIAALRLLAQRHEDDAVEITDQLATVGQRLGVARAAGNRRARARWFGIADVLGQFEGFGGRGTVRAPATQQPV